MLVNCAIRKKLSYRYEDDDVYFEYSGGMGEAEHLGQTLTEENGWDVDTKTKIISELNEVAKVDGHVCDNEKEWLIGLANDMGL